MSATPKPKVRPVTRWAVIYANPNGGWNIGGSFYLAGSAARIHARHNRASGVKARAIRVRITPVESKKAKKGAGR